MLFFYFPHFRKKFALSVLISSKKNIQCFTLLKMSEFSKKKKETQDVVKVRNNRIFG